jgi:hypothetical protein
MLFTAENAENAENAEFLGGTAARGYGLDRKGVLNL